MAGDKVGTIVTNSNSILNDFELVKLYKTLACANASSYLSSVQSYLSDCKSTALYSSFLALLCEQYVTHFRECYNRESSHAESVVGVTNHCTGPCNGSTDIPCNGNRDKNDVQAEFDRFIHDNACTAIPEEKKPMQRMQRASVSSFGSMRKTDDVSLTDIFPASARNRRMSADDIALAQRNGDCNEDTKHHGFSKKKKLSMKRAMSRRSSVKDSERYKMDEDSAFIKEVADGSTKVNIMTSMLNRIRRSSKGSISTPSGKVPEESKMKIDMHVGFLHVPQSSKKFSFQKAVFQKAKIVLRQVGQEHFVDVYTPIKNSRPKVTIVGSEITEVRPTTELEMPEVSDAFVIKTNGEEYVIKLNRHMDFATWMSAIEELSIQSGKKLQVYEIHKHPFLPENLRASPPSSAAEATSSDDAAQQSDVSTTPPNLVPNELSSEVGTSENGERTSLVPLGSWEATMALMETGTSPQDEETTEPRSPPDLNRFPWYHGDVSRNDAVKLVLGGTHGVFLLRVSQTRPSYVLTFNVHGRAKHLRMTIESDGTCVVQHLRFNSVFDMLEHFRKHPIPLESGSSGQVSLTDFIINENCETMVTSNETPHDDTENGDDTADTTFTNGGFEVSTEGSSTSNHVSSGFGSSPNLGSRSSSLNVDNPDESQEDLPHASSHARAVNNVYTFS